MSKKGVTNTDLDKIRRKYIKKPKIINGLTDKIIVYFNNLMSCNNIDKNIKNLLVDDVNIEKTIRMKELFPTVKSPSETECIDILSLIWKMPALANGPSHEYAWFKNLINMVENIPICITISSAKKEFFGFPLVYVNKQFETTTGYNRTEDILGQSCKFLQPDEPILEEEPHHVLLSKSLREGLSTSVILTNIHKNGSPFYNLLSLKPIFDTEGNYIYCIGIQTEINSDTISKHRVQNIIDVLNILCS